MASMKLGRNDPCRCGSGKKHKHCCEGKSVPHTATPLPAETNQLVMLFNTRRYGELENQSRTLLVRYPDFAIAWKLLGAALMMQGKDTLAAFRKTVELMPGDGPAHYNLGNALKDLGQFEDAAASFRRALKLKSDFAEAHNNLGLALRNLGQPKDAAESYRRALEIKPDMAEAHTNLGLALRDLGQFEKAQSSCRMALESNPGYAEAHNNLGIVLYDQSLYKEALASYRRALELKPDLVEAHNNLGNTLKDTGQLDAALASYRRALELKPDYVEAHNNLGSTLLSLGKVADAAACFRRALEINPLFASAHNNLGSALKDTGQLDKALVSYRRALEIKPDFAEAHASLGGVLQDMGNLDAAVTCYRRSLEIRPDYSDAYSNLLFLYSYHALLDPAQYRIFAQGWEHACLPEPDRNAAHNRTFSRTSLVSRKLKVGYVSGDYRQHAVSYFIEQLFAHHDRSRIELYAYSTQNIRDAVTLRLQALVDHWIDLAELSDDAARTRIENDGIDVLIDLSGHTQHNRMGVFASRAAPVQAHYLGYFASTGLTGMDYWIGDDILTPAETDSHFSERIWRLPRVWVCYDGKSDAPPTSWQPDPDGVVWVGSFNNLGKLTPETLALWAKVLHALPEGKLLLKTKELADSGNRQRILDVMSVHGIAPDRIELQDGRTTTDWNAHMSYYDRLDIALDPVGGLAGGTTTCDALWMGVPVITREGDRMASRMTATMLNAIGHPEWMARNDDEYIGKVVALARDTEQRRTLRPGQRNRMASSLLCDASNLAVSLENSYMEMFERWENKNN